MTSWLQQAQAANAELSEVIAGARAETMRRGIDLRLSTRRTTRRALVGATALSVSVAAAVLALRPPETPRPVREAPLAAARPQLDTEAHALRSYRPAPILRELRFIDGSRASALDATTQVEIERDDAKGARTALRAGSATFDVQPRAGKPFVVVAGNIEVHVVGTRFTVSRSSSEQIAVAVEHGEVEVRALRERVRVQAGERATFDGAARVEIQRVRERAKQASPPADVVGDLLATADRARRQGHSAAAVAALQQVVNEHARDPRAPSAAFSLGRVLLEGQAKPKDAAQAFARVRTLDPRSPLAEDALAREVEARARAGDFARARSLAEQYLVLYPNGARAAIVRSRVQLE